MTDNPIIRPEFVRHIAIPQDHGSWIFILSPLLIGLFAGDDFGVASIVLIIAALSAFLIRQPVIIAVKAYSGRRSKRDLPVARFWILIYGLIGFVSLIGLIQQGLAYLLYLVIPGVLVFLWHLFLISRRAERRKIGIEIVGSGVLAMAAPGAYWVGVGYPDPQGWLLFLLVWLQSAASIVYAYLRLQQRELSSKPNFAIRLQMGRRALLYTSFNLVISMLLSFSLITPPLLPLPYAIQWIETLWGTLIYPAIGIKPTKIGIRQLIVSSLFTLTFILIWNV